MIRDGLRKARTWIGQRVGPREWWIAFTVFLGIGALGAGVAWGTWTHICDRCPSIAQIYAFEPKEATRRLRRGRQPPRGPCHRAPNGHPVHGPPPARRRRVHRGRGSAILEAPGHRRSKVRPCRGRVRVRRLRRGGREHDHAAAGGQHVHGRREPAGHLGPAEASRDAGGESPRRRLLEDRDPRGRTSTRSTSTACTASRTRPQRYFGKDAWNLNLPEAALLAGMPRAPARYSPIRHPERAVQRRNLVISLMAGQGMVTREEASAAMAYPLVVRDGTGDIAPASVLRGVGAAHPVRALRRPDLRIGLQGLHHARSRRCRS